MQPGDQLIIGGPRGSLLIPVDYQWQLYLCDETGLPALKRRLAELKEAASTAKIIVLVNVKEDSCIRYLEDDAAFNIEWVVSHGLHGEQEKDAVWQKVKSLSLPESDYYIWATGEGKLVKGLQDYFTVTKGLDPAYVRCVAYWHHK